VNTGTGDGTLRLDGQRHGLTTVSNNTPFYDGRRVHHHQGTSGPAAAQHQGTGGTGSIVTAFVDVVQVLIGGLSPFANALQNGSLKPTTHQGQQHLWC
jgi:hypothetical protein